MYICVCNAVTDHAIRDAVAEGARTLEDLTMRTGCASTCATCRDSAQALLDELLRRRDLDPTFQKGLG
jgi:bacterioferritin-associated ferredoxin